MPNRIPPYVPAVIPPDPARDARVAARRAADALKAGAALDRLLVPGPEAGMYAAGYLSGWDDGYAASDLHHNRHYGVPGVAAPNGMERPGEHWNARLIREQDDAWADAWPDGAV